MKQSCVVLRSSSGSGLGSGSGASVLVFVMRQIFLNSFFKWPFNFSGERGICLYMRYSVSISQVTRWPFLIAFINVEVVGLKHVGWGNWANYFLVLFIWKMELSDCLGLLVGFNRISQIPS